MQSRQIVLDVITPPATHLAAIEAAAAKRGVDVICQKPFCEDAGRKPEAATNIAAKPPAFA